MRDFSANPLEILASLRHHRQLVKTSIMREILGRYRGSVMGVLWSFFNPLFMLAIYTFVFSEVFKARWGSSSASKTEFAMLLFAGLIVFNLFSDCVNRAPGLILANPNYVKKVVYPLEILPCISLGAALFHSLISLLVWLAAYCIFFGPPHGTIFCLPLVFLPFLLFILGLSWFLASLGVFLRDVSQFIGIVTSAMIFLSPIFYPVSALPESYRAMIYLNPLTTVVEQTRAVLYWGVWPDFMVLGFYTALATLLAFLGFAWFQKTRKGFADVL